MNSSQLQHDFEKDRLLGVVRRRRRTLGLLRSLPLVMAAAAGLLWMTANRGESSLVPTAHDGQVNAESVDPREARIIESDEELLSLLEEFGPVLATREDGTQVLMLTAAEP